MHRHMPIPRTVAAIQDTSLKLIVVFAALFLAALAALASGPKGLPSPAPSASPAARDTELWPLKEQILYMHVDFTLRRVIVDKSHGPKWTITKEEKTIPACSPWTVTEGASRDPVGPMTRGRVVTFVVTGPGQNRICMKGDWSKGTFRTERECAQGLDLGSILVAPTACYAVEFDESGDRAWIHD
jgi:hypothetical protein